MIHWNRISKDEADFFGPSLIKNLPTPLIKNGILAPHQVKKTICDFRFWIERRPENHNMFSNIS